MREIEESAYLYQDIENVVLKNRIMYSLNWAIKKAVIYKRCYYTLTCFNIIAPLLVSIFHSLDSNTFLRLNIQTYSVILSTITTISAALLSLYHFKDQWKDYRKVAEQLKSELIEFHMRSDIYKDKNLTTLSESIEKIIAAGHIAELKIIDSAIDKNNNN